MGKVMKTPTRIYTVSGVASTRLVRATSPSQAMRHVAQSLFKVSVASQDDLVSHVSSGKTVEVANAIETPDAE